MFNRKNTNGLLLIGFLFAALAYSFSACNIYKFNDVSLDPNIKTVRVQNIENRARFVNPQLSPRLSDRLRQKIVSQTRLTQTNRDSVDLDIVGEIRDYSVTTAGVADNRGTGGRNQASVNRLTVTVHVTVTDRLKNEVNEYDATRTFDFSANLSIQQAENNLLDDIVRNMTDEIFNRIFSKW
jgi:hypothetical protein